MSTRTLPKGRPRGASGAKRRPEKLFESQAECGVMVRRLAASGFRTEFFKTPDDRYKVRAWDDQGKLSPMKGRRLFVDTEGELQFWEGEK